MFPDLPSNTKQSVPLAFALADPTRYRPKSRKHCTKLRIRGPESNKIQMTATFSLGADSLDRARRREERQPAPSISTAQAPTGKPRNEPAAPLEPSQLPVIKTTEPSMAT